MGSNISIENSGEFLEWLKKPGPKALSYFSGIDTYVLVALATLARKEMPSPIEVERGTDPVSRFAWAVGLDNAIKGGPLKPAKEKDRTVAISRFGWAEAKQVDPLAKNISQLITEEIGTQQFDAVKYVLVEFLRNVAQHSKDKLGGIVAAQVMERPGVSRRVQVAVADAGIGILAGLTEQGMHPGLNNVQVALEKALHPHFSGTFREGQTGTSENAGLGLYVISELAKMTGGSFLLASRGDALLSRDSSNPQERLSFINGGFPGTLVVFECGLHHLDDFNTLFKAIRDKADTRRPTNKVSGNIDYTDNAPSGVQTFLVSVASEDTVSAVKFAKNTLLPSVAVGKAIALDFKNWSVFSQSYLHALLYLVIRVAWATKAPIYVLNASPAVKSGIEWIESYALVG